MALEYFLYTELYNNTLTDRSDTSFAPTPPYGEIHIEFLIPETQPLYLFKEDSGLIVENDDITVNSYLEGTAPASQPDDNVSQYLFTGYSATTEIRLDDMTVVITGNTVDITDNASDINYISGVTDTKLNTTLFSTYTGTTAPATFAVKADAITGTTNVGTGEGLYTGITANKLQFKTLIAGTDITLVPSADSITINASGGASIYGSEYQLASSLGVSTTTSTTPQTKVSLSTTILPAGTYKVSVGWIGKHASASNDMRFDVTLNGTSQGTTSTIQIESKDVTTTYPFVRIFYLTLSGANTIVLRYWNESNSTTISDATIELIRVE